MYLCGFALVGLEGDLEYPVPESVAIERLDCDNSFVVVCHRDETESLALIGLQVSNDFDTLHSTERPEQLPQDILLSFGSQVVDEDTPTGAIHSVARQHGVSEQITG